MDEFPEEAADQVAGAEDDDGAELLGALSTDRAWKLLHLLPKEVGGRWLRACSDETLLDLTRHADPDARATPNEPRDTLERRALAALGATSR